MDVSLALTETVGRALDDAGAPRALLVGVSGGADSVALLRVVCALKKARGLRVAAVHVHHGLRESAEGDAAFVRALCEELFVPLFLERVTVEPLGSVEDAARRARYAAFRRVYARERAGALLLAHHVEDQAETVLMHLLYGAGAQGVTGMRASSRIEGMLVLRPLLETSPASLRAYLTAGGFPWREDESNGDPRFTRNFLRLKALPMLSARFSGAKENLARFSRILADEDDCLSVLAEDFLRAHGRRAPCRFVLLDAFKALPVALKRRVVRQLAQGVPMDFAQTERVLAAALIQGAKENLPDGYHTLSTGTRLFILPPEESFPPPSLGEWLCVTPYKGEAQDGKTAQVITSAQLNGAEFRCRAPGDRIHPFGAQGEKKLSDYLIDRGIDRPFRDCLPILFAGREALFVPGVGASEALRLAPDAQDALLLRLTHALPWEIQGQ